MATLLERFLDGKVNTDGIPGGNHSGGPFRRALAVIERQLGVQLRSGKFLDGTPIRRRWAETPPDARSRLLVAAAT